MMMMHRGSLEFSKKLLAVGLRKWNLKPKTFHLKGSQDIISFGEPLQLDAAAKIPAGSQNSRSIFVTSFSHHAAIKAEFNSVPSNVNKEGQIS